MIQPGPGGKNGAPAQPAGKGQAQAQQPMGKGGAMNNNAMMRPPDTTEQGATPTASPQQVDPGFMGFFRNLIPGGGGTNMVGTPRFIANPITMNPMAQGYQGMSGEQSNPNAGGFSGSPSAMMNPSTTQGGMDSGSRQLL